MHNLIAQVPSWVGNVNPPAGGGSYNTGLIPFINTGLRIVFLGFALYALVTFIIAAYNFINSQGEQEKLEKAQKMITNSVIGLVLLTSSFLFSAVIGQVFFGDWQFALDPTETINCSIIEQNLTSMSDCTIDDAKNIIRSIQNSGGSCTDIADAIQQYNATTLQSVLQGVSCSGVINTLKTITPNP